MIRLARDFRLIPIVLIATISLLVLKVSGLLFDGGYTFAERMQNHYKPQLTVRTGEKVPDYPKIIVADSKPGTSAGKRSWAQQMFNFNGGGDDDITGSVDQQKSDGPPLKVTEKPPPPPTIEAGDTSLTIEPGRVASPGERALLKSLQGRREELDKRSRELDMREALLRATEKQVEAKVSELKELEARVKTSMGVRDKQEADRFKSLVSMYENMKPKDAARIFDRLDLNILIQVSSAINPRKMSDILAQMTPDTAERLTVELAHRADAVKKRAPQQLPKIQGTPNRS
jgi:flagellar motility protein MotE (MotC chaperone)